MTDNTTTSLDDEKAEPLGDTGDGDTGVPEGEQGISNRAGDKAEDDEEDAEEEEEDDDDDFEDDFDELDETADGGVTPESTD